MFTRLWIALKNWGASEGKPFLGIQALGIPVVALVFLTIRAQFGNDTRLNSLLSATPPNWDWIVSCLILIVYSADFISDAIAWDRIGVKFATWQLVLAVGWILFGSFILLMLTVVLPLLGFGMRELALLDLLWSLRYLVLGGLVYSYFKWRGGSVLAFFGERTALVCDLLPFKIFMVQATRLYNLICGTCVKSSVVWGPGPVVRRCSP